MSRKLLFALALILPAAMLSACGATPASPAANEPPGDAASAAESSPAAPEDGAPGQASAPVQQAATARASAAEQTPNPYPGTYRKTLKNGVVMYCRSEAPLGSRMQKEICATEEVMRERKAAGREVIEDARRGGACDPSSGLC